MRKKFLSALLLCCMVLTLLPTAALADGDVAIDGTNFPDENFRQYVNTEFDTNNDDSLSAEEIAAVKQINLPNKGISSLVGVEHFTNLEDLDVQHNEDLTTLNLSKNTELKTLKCNHTKLTSLDTSHNENLVFLECNEISTLTTLNVSGSTALKHLYCNDNPLTALDLTNNLALEKLECGGNKFTTLDLSRNTNLKYFGCFNSKLSSLDLTNNTELEELYFCGNNVSNIDVSKNTKLKFLHLFSNQLITLDTSKNSNLQRLWVYTNPLTSMNLGDSGSTMEVKFDNKPYPIEVSAAEKTFNLNTLPGFDVSKASDWTNGTVNGNILTVNEGVENVTYTYDCGERQATYGDPTTTGKLMMPCTLKINWKNADGPAAPVLELDYRFANSIHVKRLGDGYEYRINDGDWQSLHYFENLQPGTEYTITARATQNPGAVSEPLKVTTLYDKIPDDLRDKLGAVVSAYIAEYDGMEHEAVIVDDTKMPEGWRIAGYTTDGGSNYSDSMPTIKNVGTLWVGVKFVHQDSYMNTTNFYTAEVTAKRLTADMIADIPDQFYTGQPIYPEPEIKHGDMVLVKGTDFNYSYKENVPPSGTVNITGKGNYTGMVSKHFTIVNEITEDVLAGLNFPTDLVTVKCTKTNSIMKYGRISGGFNLSDLKPYVENGVWKVIVYLNLPAYQNKYNVDTGKTHEYTGFEDNPHNTFTLKYVNGMWQLDGDFPKVVILAKCDGNHPQEYTITFDGNGGTPSVDSMKTVDQKLPQLPKATHSGRYSFDGWYTAASGGTMITTDTEFHENAIVYAHWTYTGSSGGSSSGRTYHTIKASSDSNGSISPSERVSVRHGRDQSFTITPDKGYEIAKVLVDGKSVGGRRGGILHLQECYEESYHRGNLHEGRRQQAHARHIHGCAEGQLL